MVRKTFNKAPTISTSAPIDTRLQQIQFAIEQLWGKIAKLTHDVETISAKADSTVTTSRLVEIVRNVDGNTHSSAMPDVSGVNADHDSRYALKSDSYTRTEVNDLMIEETYIKLVDDAGSATYYIGEAAQGSTQSAAAWRIKKIVESSGDYTITFSPNWATFGDIWNNRVGLSYT